MTNGEEAAIWQLLDELCAAWNSGDAEAFGVHYRDDGTFTNVFGSLHFGKDEFVRRHEDVFRGFLAGTRIEMTARKVRFVRPDVAVADIDMAYSGFKAMPAGIQPASDGLVHSSLLMVLVKDAAGWWITAYHNIWRAAAG